MRRIPALLVIVLAAVLMTGTTACVSTSTAKLPLFEGKEAVALVNGEPISREEYEQEISAMHFSIMSEEERAGEQKAGGKTPGKVDYAGLVKRLVNTRLILQEAKNIGLNELPEVKGSVEGYSRETLRTALIKEHEKGIKPDDAMVDKLYKRNIMEWKFASVMFAKEDDARKMEAELRTGKNFEELAEKAIAAGKAKGGKAEGYLKNDEILPGLSEALLTMTTGSVSQIINIPAGFALVKLDDARREESPEKKESAITEALQQQKSVARQEFIESLKNKYVKINKEVFDGLDYGSSPEKFEKLMTDERVVAEIAGEDPVKVSDLTDELRQKYFHGIDRAIGKTNLNEKKHMVLDEVLEKRVLLKEAAVEDIKKAASYQKVVKNYENSVVFGVFVEKVVLPEINVMESEVKAYYTQHFAEYTTSELMRLDSIAFKKRSGAETALRKLKNGDQLSWLKEHAQGQVEKDAEDLMKLAGNVFTTPELPDDLKTTLSGVSSGDSRLYAGPEGYFYIISVVAVYPSQTQDYVSVRAPIAKQLFDERIKQGVEGWADKLRAGADIRVYIEGIDI